MLKLEGVSRCFGGIEAVAALDLELAPGARLGLIGPNGSGKTTVLNLVTGVIAPDSGAIAFGGERIDDKPAHAIARLGIARTFQNLRLVPHMTVRESVAAARLARPAAPNRARVGEILGAVGLAPFADQSVASLPLAQQRRVELARALARSPRLLLLDEPAGGMTPAETRDMGNAIAALVPSETALVVVEHKIDLVRRICPRIAVLDFGRKIADGPAESVLRDRRVMDIYFGRAGEGTDA